MDEVRSLFADDVQSVLLQSPTGSGKGSCCSYMVQRANARGNRVVFGVHGRHLVHDMSERLEKLGLDHGIIMADHKRRRAWLSTQVASIDTLARRERLPHADLFVIDEARFAMSPTWKKVVDGYRAQGARILGMDATPIRSDGKGLGDIFEAMVCGPQPQELIDGKYLVPSVVYAPQGSVESRGVRNVKVTGGEFNSKAQAEIVDKPKLIGDVVKEWENNARNLTTAVFAVNKAHAQHIAERFRMAGHDFAYVDADTPDTENDPQRSRIWNDFDHGQLNGIVAIRTIQYGWDHPICACIVQAHAVRSEATHLQELGRATRPHNGKTHFVVIDHYGNWSDPNLGHYEQPRVWDLDMTKARNRTKDDAPAIARCVSCFKTFIYGKTACPYCGCPVEKKEVKVLEAEGSLGRIEKKLLTAEEWQAKLAREDQRKAKFLEFAKTQKERGYRQHWATGQFKIIFHCWPNHKWIAEAKELGLIVPNEPDKQMGLG